MQHTKNKNICAFKAIRVTILYTHLLLKMGSFNVALSTATTAVMSVLWGIWSYMKELSKHKRVWAGKGMVHNGGGLTAITVCGIVKLLDSFSLMVLAQYFCWKATKKGIY